MASPSPPSRYAPSSRRSGIRGVEDYGARGSNFTRSDAESRRFWYWVYETFCSYLGQPEPGDLPQRLYAEFIRNETYRLYPDSLPALEALRQRGVLLGVISNWEEWLEQLLLHLEIHTYFTSRTIPGPRASRSPIRASSPSR